MNEQLRVSSDQQRKLATHVVHRLPQVCLSNLIELSGRAPCPELDAGVPPATDDDSLPILIEVIYIFDRLSVLADRCDLIRWQVPLLNVVICTRYHDGRLIDAPAHTQDRRSRIVLEHYLLLDLSAHARLSLIDNKVAVPEGCEEQP